MTDTVYSAFCKTVATYPDNDFIHIPAQATADYADTAITYTYAQAADSVDVLRAIYERAGYAAGLRVALVLDNRAEMFLHLLALNALGISVVPVNSAFQAGEAGYVITHADCCLVVSLPAHLPLIAAALEGHQQAI
ncbi:MAG: AMP-binding protein, partial [Gammaproteobacteria bacterium]